MGKIYVLTTDNLLQMRIEYFCKMHKIEYRTHYAFDARGVRCLVYVFSKEDRGFIVRSIDTSYPRVRNERKYGWGIRN